MQKGKHKVSMAYVRKLERAIGRILAVDMSEYHGTGLKKKSYTYEGIDGERIPVSWHDVWVCFGNGKYNLKYNLSGSFEDGRGASRTIHHVLKAVESVQKSFGKELSK